MRGVSREQRKCYDVLVDFETLLEPVAHEGLKWTR